MYRIFYTLTSSNCFAKAKTSSNDSQCLVTLSEMISSPWYAPEIAPAIEAMVSVSPPNVIAYSMVLLNGFVV